MRRVAATLVALALLGGGCSKKPAAPAATTTADANAPIELPPYVPADAVAVIAFDGSPDWFQKYAAMSGMPGADAAAMFGDTATYLEKTTGLSLARVHRGAVVLTGDSAAVVLRDVSGEWKTKAPPDDLALVRDGEYLIAGPKAAVDKLVAVKKGSAPGLAKDAPLAQLFARGSVGAGIAFGADLQVLDIPELKQKIGAVGATHALVAIGPHVARLYAVGDGAKMKNVVSMVETMLASQVKTMNEQRARILAEASTDKGPSAEGFGVVFGSHSLAYVASIFHPVVEGNELRFELKFDSANIMPVVVVVAVMGSVAVPAFIKYLRKAKTTEAPAKLHEIMAAGMAYYATHQKLPPSIASTPAPGACCTQPEGRCSGAKIDWSGWKALDFHIDEPFDYSYAFDADKTGFTARAIGDLDCDGVFSTFEGAAIIDDHGIRAVDGLYKNNELE